ncbi:hypothetical protein F383_15472 [Gossypium arboreum]|uniref:Uncharacterized protein n=1 Tax=Gossypium arboreum TaxID=29729 RepID=A0A0B0PQ45_GOSAR|nr:hypothetical protein F383_15472 [Gossypium arboreum]
MKIKGVSLGKLSV